MNSIIKVAQALISFAGILIVAFFALWHVQLVIIVTVIATAIAALAFITVTPKVALFKFDRSWRPIHFKLRGALAPPAIKSGDPSAFDSSSIGSFARFNFLDCLVGQGITFAAVWIIAIFLVASQLGVYTVATYVGLPITILITAITIAFWPRVASVTTLKENKALLRRAMLLTIVAVIGALFYAVFAPLLIPFVFGARYASGIPVARLLCLGYCVWLLTLPINLICFNFGGVRIGWLINLLALSIIVTVNVWLLPIIGVLAAALAWFIAQIASGACTGIFLWSRMKRFTTQDIAPD